MQRESLRQRAWKALTAVILAGMFWFGALGTGYAEESAGSKNIVDPYQVYTYERMLEHTDRLAAAYPDLIRNQSIGTTAFGREIRAVKLGKGEATILIDGSQHAREWMGTNLIMYMIDRYAYAYENNMKYDNYIVRELLDRCTIWFVPMVNPDGVTLQQQGLAAFPPSYHADLLRMNGNSSNFKQWKANAQGIDINRQYPAMWDYIRNSPQYPTFKNYKGSAPAETAEAKSMIGFTYAIDPEIALSYHTSGEVLYWHFFTKPEVLDRDKRMADAITGMTGYSQVKPEQYPSGGGYTDWFIAGFDRPGFTAELGPYQEETELPLWTFTGIWKENEKLGFYLADEGYKLWHARFPIQQIDEKLELLGAAKMFNRPNEAYFTGAEVRGQVVADARLNDWFRIETWLGKKWVYLPPDAYLKGYSEPFTDKVKLTEAAALYHYPSLEHGIPLGQLQPQQVKAVKRWNDWLLVETWQGHAWIQVKEQAVQGGKENGNQTKPEK
ncbi:M14 family zinc carboxypeptidase [Paenibacillus chartarius]|uniref:M14 family zinc carboxypeptidase n=1 Tax=Paenibacillus chartarius TaxID=747481 RepID=A0ABV6DMQ0_9BACL